MGLAAGFFWLFAAGMAAADVYKYRDENGVTHLTNIPQQLANGPYELYRADERTRPKGWSDGSLLLGKLELERYADLIRLNADRHNVPESLIRAVIHAESAFRPDAISPKGAGGLMQLMPATAERFGVRDRFDPEQNIAGGVAYLAFLLDHFNNDQRLAVAAYNAGEGAVGRYNGIPPFKETQTYVRRVEALQQRYRNKLAQLGR
ncbi:MAG TPA: DUF4124 domain-containing protein [Halothiobacillaceae bacterium]|nr:DUF4124 domain-containing protein [Halothiobacillaceae bacterium]